MPENNSHPNGNDMRQYVWNYFQSHASQRLTTFNFYIVICTVAATGYLTAMQENKMPVLGIVLGFLLSFLSFIFWKLDCRNKQMIKNAEEALMYLENQFETEDNSGNPHVVRIFTYEKAQTERIREIRSVWPWKNHFSYSRCLNSVFAVFGILGGLAALYAATVFLTA